QHVKNINLVKDRSIDNDRIPLEIVLPLQYDETVYLNYGNNVNDVDIIEGFEKSVEAQSGPQPLLSQPLLSERPPSLPPSFPPSLPPSFPPSVPQYQRIPVVSSSPSSQAQSPSQVQSQAQA